MEGLIQPSDRAPMPQPQAAGAPPWTRLIATTTTPRSQPLRRDALPPRRRLLVEDELEACPKVRRSQQVYFLREAAQKANTNTTSVEAQVLVFRMRGSPTSDFGPCPRAAKNACPSSSPTEVMTSVRFSSCVSGLGAWKPSPDADRGRGGVFKGGRTSAWDTPPKKSVTSASWRGRLKRSERTPGCERILTGSYVLNCANMVRQEALRAEGKRVTYEILHSGLARLVDTFHEL